MRIGCDHRDEDRVGLLVPDGVAPGVEPGPDRDRKEGQKETERETGRKTAAERPSDRLVEGLSGRGFRWHQRVAPKAKEKDGQTDAAADRADDTDHDR